MARQYRSVKLQRLESLRRIVQELGWYRDTNDMLEGVLKQICAAFESDHVWLLHPCDPEAASYQVRYECGVASHGRREQIDKQITIDTQTTTVMDRAIRSKMPEPAVCEFPHCHQNEHVHYATVMALFPRIGQPWLLGVHDGLTERQPVQEGQALLKDIALVVSAVLNFQLLHQSLRQSFQTQHALMKLDSIEDDLLRGGLDTLSALIGPRLAAMALFNDDGGIKALFQSGANYGNHESIRKLVDKNGALDEALNDHDVLRIENVTKDPRTCDLRFDGLSIKSMLVASVKHRGKLVARACLADKWNRAPFTTDDQSIVGSFGNALSLMLEGIREQSECRHAQEVLRKSESDYRRVVESARDAIFTISCEAKFTSLNAAFEIITGFPREQWIGRNYQEILAPDTLIKAEKIIRATMQGKKMPLMEFRFLTQSGDYHYGELTTEPLFENGCVIGMLGIARDVTERKRSQQNLHLAASVFDNSLEGIMITDPEGIILRVNPAFSSVTGYRSEEVIGRSTNVLKSQRHDEAFFSRMWNTLKEYGHWQGEVWNCRKNGETYPEWLSISEVCNDEGKVTHYIGVFADITEKKISEERIQQLAHYDPLTDLPNRRLFRDRVEQVIAHAQRNGQCVGLLYLDLDRFKAINDSLGHTAGDQLLREVAQRLQDCVRETDTVSRIGGDEFTIILSDFADANQALQGMSNVAKKVLKWIAQPLSIDHHEVFVTTSIGAALFPQDGAKEIDLIRKADIAMYHAKELGKNNLQFYSDEMNAKAKERLIMEHRLRMAIEQKDFVLYYQPLVDTRDGHITGIEALLRWRKNGGSPILPMEFVPLTEETGLIVPLGEWVLRSACRQLHEWHVAGHNELRVSVNISTRQFQQEDLGEMVARILEDTAVPPGSLELELTESCLINHQELLIPTLKYFKDLGVSLALDDFGTGYSSLSFLKHFPLDTLKIDRSFVQGLHRNNQDHAITLAIVALARRLELGTVAEGVETQQQLDVLRKHQCSRAQGYLFSKPVPPEDITRWLQTGTIH